MYLPRSVVKVAVFPYNRMAMRTASTKIAEGTAHHREEMQDILSSINKS